MSERVTIADVGFSCATCFFAVTMLRQAFTHPSWQFEELICMRFPKPLRVDNGHSCGEWRTDQEPPPGIDLAETPDHVCELCEGTGARDGKPCDGCAGVGAV